MPTPDPVKKPVVKLIAFWGLWIYLMKVGPITKFGAALFSAQARGPLAFVVVGTLGLFVWSCIAITRARRADEKQEGQEENDIDSRKGHFLGVLAWGAIGGFCMVFPAIFLGSSKASPFFFLMGLAAWAIGVLTAFTKGRSFQPTDFSD